MLERRKQPRIHPGSPLTATLVLATKDTQTTYSGCVEDISGQGFKVLLAASSTHHLKTGQTLQGVLHAEQGDRNWQGTITHLHHHHGGTSIGIALDSRHTTTGTLLPTVASVLQDPKSGGITLRREGDQLILEVVGRLFLALSRDFLHLVRGGSVAAIDLKRCVGLDSAGLGMLCIATDARIPLINASGKVKELLEVARVRLSPTALSPRSTQRIHNPIRAGSIPCPPPRQ